MSNQDEFDSVMANKIVLYCCMMTLVVLALIVFTDIKQSVDDLEDTYVWQVGIWTCWMVLVSMSVYGAVYILRFAIKRWRRGRSS